jgi:AcrR family transcriptional regulator
MAETLDTVTPNRRRRSDALRSIDAILNAARIVLNERPDASMEDIATTAGVTRQTVYAHFPSRDALIAALLRAAGAEIRSAIDASHIDTAPPADALRQFFGICWHFAGRYPLLLDPALTRISPPEGHAVHQAATALLEQLVQRGQRTGDFDSTLSANWLTAAILGLTHTATEQIAAGRLASSDATAVLMESVLRLCGAIGARC